MYEFPSTPAAQWRSRMDLSLRELEIVEEESRFYQAQRYAGAAEAWQVFADQFGPDISTDRSSMQQRSFRAELATVLSIPEVTAENLLGRARILVGSIADTFRAFEAGRISERHATILADAVAPLGPDDTAELERRALPHAEKLTAAKFARKVEHLREMIRPSEATERHREAVKERELYVQPAPNGMAWVHALMRSIHAAAIDDYADKLANANASEGDDDDRTHIQRRLDAFVDLILDKGVILPPVDEEHGLRQRQPSGIVPTVHVTVPALTITGESDEPATLDGIGPIDPETARELIGCAPGMYRILTHPDTGVAVHFGRTRYQVPAELRRFLQVRDGTCRFPGCNRRAARCEVDHTKDWQHLGPSDAVNLGHLCKKHHALKHGSGWTVRQEPRSAVYAWTSPTGRAHTT
ncbi:MAG TPA: DUF222 domain-containing protein, partial [Naasia sp.]